MAVPLHFGPASSPLYGVFHPSKETGTPGSALLICPSPGYEFMRSHRALRTLAEQCARKNVAAFRFDYRGVGHSPLDLESVSLSDWTEDVRLAAEELCTLAGVSTIKVLGLRLGALIALYSLAGNSVVDDFILWDPVLEGADFFESMIEAEAGLLAEKDPYLTAPNRSEVQEDGVQAFLGYGFSSQLVQDISALSLADSRAGESSVVVLTGGDATHVAKISGLPVEQVHAPDSWCEIDNFGSVLLPQEMIRVISSKVSTL